MLSTWLPNPLDGSPKKEKTKKKNNKKKQVTSHTQSWMARRTESPLTMRLFRRRWTDQYMPDGGAVGLAGHPLLVLAVGATDRLPDPAMSRHQRINQEAYIYIGVRRYLRVDDGGAAGPTGAPPRVPIAGTYIRLAARFRPPRPPVSFDSSDRKPIETNKSMALWSNGQQRPQASALAVAWPGKSSQRKAKRSGWQRASARCLVPTWQFSHHWWFPSL